MTGVDHNISPLTAGLRCRCPRCGQGRLFSGPLDIADKCSACELDYGFADAGDGPAVFVILILGALLVGGALIVERIFSPPPWLQLAIWIPLALILGLALLRPFKATLIALQYRNSAREGRLGDD